MEYLHHKDKHEVKKVQIVPDQIQILPVLIVPAQVIGD